MLTSLHLPRDAAEAALLAAQPGSAVLAGGTVVMPAVNAGAHGWTQLVCLARSVLAGVRIENRRAQIGAATTLAEIGRHPELEFLQAAIESIGSPNLRNLATIGGNLFVAQPYGDLAVCLLALEATVAVQSTEGVRELPVEAVIADGVGDGIVVSVGFELPAQGSWFYRKAMRRQQNSGAIVTIAAWLPVEDGKVAKARVALGGCGPRPRRAPSAEAALIGRKLDAQAVEAAAAVIGGDAEPFTDALASAWYRARVLPVHFRRALLGE
ncbi:FAD binding domain-containing protein [Geminicoccus roseus]|uniref:FAD binding domain-containing protein n=1 Tax=Geminicoccus roseus TaxID=404900 RepID=UPI0003FB4278|nr:FAD binding domain-containing protein [Geminicoccus roseus]